MPIVKFPPVDAADENGLVALGGDLTIPSLVLAYRNGIFPWPISDEYPLAWFSPDPRGILEVNELHLNKSFKRFLKNCTWDVTFNQNFREVIELCSQVARKHQASTWITHELKEAYCEMFEQGLAYSVEVWDGKNLVGGLYGVKILKFVSGESMFHLESNASKVALYALIKYLEQEEISWLDTQMVTPVVASFGGKEVARENFLEKLKVAFKA